MTQRTSVASTGKYPHPMTATSAPSVSGISEEKSEHERNETSRQIPPISPGACRLLPGLVSRRTTSISGAPLGASAGCTCSTAIP